MKLVLKVAGSVIALVITAVFAASDTIQVLNIPARWLSLIGLSIFAVSIYWTIYGQYTELHRIKTSVPRLILDRTEPTVENVAKVVVDKSGNQKFKG